MTEEEAVVVSRAQKARIKHFFILCGAGMAEMSRMVMPAWRIMVYKRIYLKVCEGCGSLWFRSQESTNVYCTSCEVRLRGFSRTTKRRPGRPPVHARHSTANGGVR